VATALYNLGRVYGKLGMYEEATRYSQRALSIRRNVLGNQHPMLALTLNLLGELRCAQGAFADAEAFYQQALAIQEKALGPDHPDTARTMINYARLMRQTSRKRQAKALEARGRTILSIKARENPANWTVDVSDFAGQNK